MKCIIVYKNIYTSCAKRIFDSVEEMEVFIEENELRKDNVIYLGEYIPLTFKMKVGI